MLALQDKPEGKLTDMWGEDLSSSGLATVDVSGALADILSVKDANEITNVKKAAFMTASVMKSSTIPRLEGTASTQIVCQQCVIKSGPCKPVKLLYMLLRLTSCVCTWRILKTAGCTESHSVPVQWTSGMDSRFGHSSLLSQSTPRRCSYPCTRACSPCVSVLVVTNVISVMCLDRMQVVVNFQTAASSMTTQFSMLHNIL